MDGQFTEDEDGDQNKRGVINGGELLGGDLERLYGWPSSRIVRVSRASGGKDRHSKVLTSKGLRDRRVRLSVNTAIQFYDLQDRLGYDQPSKALEWLLKAAAESIDELPPMNNPFAVISNHFRDEKRCSAAGSDRMAAIDVDDGNRAVDLGFPQPQMTKSSACSSTSETSKGSGGLSLCRSERRNKAREWGKVRVVAEENESSHIAGELNYISQATSFTELLSGGINNANNNQSSTGANANGPNFFLKSPRNWSSSPMDYFSSGLLDHTAARSGQMNLSSSNPFMPVSSSSLFTMVADHQPELQHFFLPELVPGVNAAGGGSNNDGIPPNLNFTISGNSSGSLAGFNREALQSNSSPPSSLLPQLHRFSDGSPQGFYLENHHNHQFLHKYDTLCYGDAHCDNDTIGGSHSGQKGKSKS